MEGIKTSVQKALKAERILPRPHGSQGIWLAFLLPAAVIIGSLRVSQVSETYLLCAVYSFNLLLNLMHLFYHILKYKSLSVTKGLNILCTIPAGITIYLYIQLLNLDFKRSLCHAAANALIYFEGVPFLLKVFPRTFSFGEANIVIQGLSLFIYSVFLSLNSIMVEGPPKSEYDESTVILQLALSWTLIFCVVPYVYSGLRKVWPLYLWGFVVLIIIYTSIYLVLKCDLVFWIWNFLAKPERIGIITLWLICSAAAVVIVQHQIQKRKKSGTILRKYFHVLTVIVFITGILMDGDLIYFSSGCVLALFFILEVFRILKVPPMHTFLQEGFRAYCDEKDSGVLALTPICLLLGNSLPLWLYPSKNYSQEGLLVLLSGVLSVGIGDTFASVGGKLFGKHKWKGTIKTIEGTVFCILSQVLFMQVLVSFGLLQNSSALLVKGLTAILVTSLVEALTDQIDNIVLPLLMYVLLI